MAKFFLAKAGNGLWEWSCDSTSREVQAADSKIDGNLQKHWLAWGFKRLLVIGCQPDKKLPHQENSCDPKSPIPGGLHGSDMLRLEPS